MEQKKDRRAVGVKILPEGVEEYCERHTTALTELHEKLIMRSIKDRVPVVSEGSDWAKDGALLTYAANSYEPWKRSASYVDKILKGAKPADLPVMQSEKFELAINLKTAKALNVIVPASLIARADTVIE